MYSTLITAVALFAAPALAAFAINSPELKQCETSKISWEKTEGPYNLIAVNAADPCGEPLVEIGDFEGSSVQWKTILPAGSVIQLSVADKNDEEAWSANITIGASSDSSCLPGAAGAASTDTTTTSAGTTGSTTSGQTTTNTGSGSTGSTDSGSEDDGPIVPVGAANAGSNGVFNNAAPSSRTLATPAMALAAIAAVAALAL